MRVRDKELMCRIEGVGGVVDGWVHEPLCRCAFQCKDWRDSGKSAPSHIYDTKANDIKALYRGPAHRHCMQVLLYTKTLSKDTIHKPCT